MTYVVAQPCIGSKDRSCVEVCPVDCFYDYDDPKLNEKYGAEPRRPGDYGMLVIHPDECIHCGACEPECPVSAIFEEDDVPEKWAEFVQINAEVTKGMSAEELDKKRVTVKS